MLRPHLPLGLVLGTLLLSGCIPTESARTRGDTPPPRLDADASTVELVEQEPVWTAQQVVADAQTVAASRYVVQPGDTLLGIGNRTGVGSDMIALANALPAARRAGLVHPRRPLSSGGRGRDRDRDRRRLWRALE